MGLFSTTHIHRHSDVIRMTATITENRAPTDESVRLLNEFEEKAKANIIATIKLPDNVINAVVIFFRKDVLTENIEYQCKFSINGREITFGDTVDKWDWADDISEGISLVGNQALLHAIHKRFSAAIAEEIMRQSARYLNGLKEMQ